MQNSFLTAPDIIVFFVALIGVMAAGLIAGRKEETSEDYFLAGRGLPWWGVAGSIFGSNVSANHMVGMMGVGFSIGFAQSHFELGAIFGLLFLCYGFLPVYRRLKVYTLSEYLGRRFNDSSRLAYAVIMIVIMVIVQMVPGLYIGARSICLLVGGDAAETAPAELPVDDDAEVNEGPTKLNVDRGYYIGFVIALACVSALYTIFGGLKAVVWTDVIQSVLLLIAGIVVAILTFDMLGGWSVMMAQEGAAEKMSLYRPSNHPKLPWSGALTGLLVMHMYYWGTNQFIVQRALGARSDEEAQLGIIAAGFLKLLIPFFAIAAGIAAFYLFQRELPDRQVDPDAAFPELVKLVMPLGVGVVGLIAAGLIGAILSSIDSMMNSSATIFSIDIYRRYIRPTATDAEMIWIGRVSIVAFVTLAAFLAIFVLDPNSQDTFFLQIANYQNYFTPGLLVAFLLGMFWKRTTSAAALVTIVGGIIFSAATEQVYDSAFGMPPLAYQINMGEQTVENIPDADWPDKLQDASLAERTAWTQSFAITPVNRFLGARLNFLHRVAIVVLLCLLLCIGVSVLTPPPDEQKAKLTWTELGGHKQSDLKRLVFRIGSVIAILILIAAGLVHGDLTPTPAAILGALVTFIAYVPAIIRQSRGRPLPTCDKLWAAILCSTVVFIHYYFY